MEFLKKYGVKIVLFVVIAVVLYFAYKEYQKMKAEEDKPKNTGIVPPGFIPVNEGYMQGDLNLDGIVNEMDS